MNSFVPLTSVLPSALAGGYAVGQFNLCNLEITQAILQGAQDERAPVILGVSESYIPYMGGLPCVVAMTSALIGHYGITVPVVLHLDHGSSFEVCARAIRAGFSSVMIDASHRSLEENIAVTRRVTEMAHATGVSVEAELGTISGREDDIVLSEAEASYARVADCELLARETDTDALAPALGSVHGPYRGTPQLGFHRMAEIRARTGLPLVLHGGSGLPETDLRRAIECGSAKINVNTDNQMALTAAVREYLTANDTEYDPRRYLGPGREAVRVAVRQKIRLFGSNGKAR